MKLPKTHGSETEILANIPRIGLLDDWQRVATSSIVALFLMAVMLGLFGCAASSHNLGAGSLSGSNGVSASEEIKQQLGTIGVTPTQIKQPIKPMDASTIPEGALEGGDKGLPFWCGLPIPGKIIVCLPMAAASLIEAASTDTSETLKQSERTINEAFSTEPVGDSLANQLVESLRKHRVNAIRTEGGPLTKPGGNSDPPASNTSLETEIADLRLSFVPTKELNSFQLLMTVQSKLLRRSDGVELSSHSVTYQSPKRSLIDWTADDAEVFRSELRTGAKRVAAELVDFLVLEYPAHIEPLMPQDGVAVRSAQPTLGWTPSFQDQISQDVLSRIYRNTFDLRISHKGTIVYERSDLLKALHKVEDPLPSCTDYDWRVRARFELDGRMRVSRWSPSQSFKTPC
jgi:hypothetical protein